MKQDGPKMLRMGFRAGFLVLFFTATLATVYGMSFAAEEEKERWSLEFNNMAVADVLSELTRVTGVEIFANKLPEKKPLKKSYVNQTIDQMVRDIFRGTSFALVWHHGEKGIRSLDVWVFDGDQSPSTGFTRIERQFSPPVRSPVQLPDGGGGGDDADSDDDTDEGEDAEEERPRPQRIRGPSPEAEDDSEEDAPVGSAPPQSQPPSGRENEDEARPEGQVP
jgi:hypothetical protein